MALVGVEHLGLGGAGELGARAQGADSADAEQQLLQQPVLAAAAVEPVGDVALGAARCPRCRSRAAAAGRGRPAACQTCACSVRPPGSADRDDDRRAVRLRSSESGRPSGSSDRVGLLLPAVAATATAEVAGAVEQADADDRDAEVAGGLQVVAGEDAEAAGVLRQDRGDAELGREVGDVLRRVRRRATGTSGLGEVRAARSPAARPPRADEVLVLGELREPRRATAPSSRDRVVPDLLPQRRVDARRTAPGSRLARTSGGWPRAPSGPATRAGRCGR